MFPTIVRAWVLDEEGRGEDGSAIRKDRAAPLH